MRWRRVREMKIKPSLKVYLFSEMRMFFPAEATDALRLSQDLMTAGKVKYFSGGVVQLNVMGFNLDQLSNDLRKFYQGGIPFLMFDKGSRWFLWNYTVDPYEPKKRRLFQSGQYICTVEDAPIPVETMDSSPGPYLPFFMENKAQILLRIQRAATLMTVVGDL